MLVTAALLVGIVLALTGWVTHRVRGREVNAAWVAPLWGGGVVLAIAAIAWVSYINARLDYDQCVFTADRSADGREQTEQLYDTIDEATGTTRFTSTPILPGQPSLRDSLDINLPVLDRADCPKP